MTINKKIAFIGAGNMGEALIKGIINASLIEKKNILVYDKNPKRLLHIKETYRIVSTENSKNAVTRADIIVLAIKPQTMDTVLSGIKNEIKKEHLIVSIAAGVPIFSIKKRLHPSARVIRVMPNTPCLVQAGACAYAHYDNLSQMELKIITDIFNCIGISIPIEEKLMDAVTGLSGSGPAYVALVIEALTDAGVKMGIQRETSKALSLHTVLGTAKLLLETNISPAALKDMVTSPGGTTIFGLHQLEKGGVKNSFINAVEKATKRAQELGKL